MIKLYFAVLLGMTVSVVWSLNVFPSWEGKPGGDGAAVCNPDGDINRENGIITLHGFPFRSVELIRCIDGDWGETSHGIVALFANGLSYAVIFYYFFVLSGKFTREPT